MSYRVSEDSNLPRDVVQKVSSGFPSVLRKNFPFFFLQGQLTLTKS